MSGVIFRSDMDVRLVGSLGNDHSVTAAARVSTVGGGAEGISRVKDEGLINYLMRDRHGSPFEHVVFKWTITAPIFVWREFMRHRMASYNEESGRYKELEPVFYVPGPDRKLQQIGKAGAYTFIQGTDMQQNIVASEIQEASLHAYSAYKNMLNAGVAREVARMCLPLNIYSTAYVTMNARALMNFLSLRRAVAGSTYPSFPQREIEMVAEKMEEDFEKVTPLVHKAFNQHGRVSP